MKISDRIRQGLSIRGMKQVDLVAKTQIGKSSISTYISGEYEPKQRNIYKIAKALDVSEAWLMGYDVPMERNTAITSESIEESDVLSIPNTLPLPKTHKLPLYGNIACGKPIYAEQNIEEYIDVPESVHADFCLRCNGDSMINARILDGDIVFIKSQPTVDDGEIAAVLIDDEATLKRVYYDREENMLTLIPENPMCKVFRYYGEELEEIRILGKAIYFTSLIN